MKEKQSGLSEHIERLWGGLPVVDGDHDLRVFITQDDLDNAVRKDPGACVFAAACKRIFGSSKVLFFKSVAYVDLPDENGNHRVERFEMPRSMRALVEAFDRGEMTIPEAGFLLKKPLPSNSLDYIRSGEKQKDRKKRDALLKGYSTPNSGRIARPITIDMSVRSGQGMAQFSRKRKTKEQVENV
jgi:hypothetical protein